MIEIICNETENQESDVVIKPPKNIRQIGSPRGRHKVYMEDYVYTFLHGSVFEENMQKRGAILVGKSEVSQDIRYTFVSGAVNCSEFIFGEDGIVFDESCWEYIYKEIKKYFPEQEIVGWFMGVNGFPLELSPTVEAAHRKYFAGRDKVLVLTETLEGEDVLFSYEQGILQKKEGYYIYYEKNIPMQEYMVNIRQQAGKQEKVEEEMEVTEKSNAEQALQNYRNMFLERQNHNPQKRMSILLYTAASAAMIMLCVIGITGINNHEKMKMLEQTVVALSQNVSETENAEEIQTQQETVTIETVPGQVVPEVSTVTETMNQPEVTQQAEVSTQPEAPIPAEVITQPETPVEQETVSAAQSYIEQGYYVVQPGEGLALICETIYGNTEMMDELCVQNQIDDVDEIYAGQKLILP